MKENYTKTKQCYVRGTMSPEQRGAELLSTVAHI